MSDDDENIEMNFTVAPDGKLEFHAYETVKHDLRTLVEPIAEAMRQRLQQYVGRDSVTPALMEKIRGEFLALLQPVFADKIRVECQPSKQSPDVVTLTLVTADPDISRVFQELLNE